MDEYQINKMEISKIKYCFKSINILLFLIVAIKPINIFSQQNLGFENGLKNWVIKNKNPDISIDILNAHDGKKCVKIGNGEINQQINAVPFSVIEIHAFTKLSDSIISGYSFLRFYDATNKVLLEYTSKLSRSTTYQTTGFYTEAPFATKYFTVGIHKNSGSKGYIYADAFTINTHVGEPAIKHLPQCNLDEYMRPFWNTDTIYNEAVLMYSEAGKPAMGKLLFMPSKVLSILDFSLQKTFLPNKDYNIEGNKIFCTEQSQMPFRADTSFDSKNDLAWFNLQSQWVNVTYTHHDKWNGPTPAFEGDKMPNTMAKLKARLPLKIIAYGMSITRGLDVSSYDTVPPFMPTYVDLFCGQLKKKFGYRDIKIFNAGLPGATVDWGAEYADKYINPMIPDLVVIDFGMNDFWRYTPEQFKGYIQTIINKVKAANPKAEFLLLSNLQFDPDYIIDLDKNKKFYVDNLLGYNLVLQQLQTTGVVNLDMTTLSGFIYQQKKAKDCLANPLHPNDYLARWYAQAMVALFR